jgi:hypothetical protein
MDNHRCYVIFLLGAPIPEEVYHLDAATLGRCSWWTVVRKLSSWQRLCASVNGNVCVVGSESVHGGGFFRRKKKRTGSRFLGWLFVPCPMFSLNSLADLASRMCSNLREQELCVRASRISHQPLPCPRHRNRPANDPLGYRHSLSRRFT